MRVVLGSVASLFYLANYPDRYLLFGPEAVWPWDQFIDALASGSFSAYGVSTSHLWFEVVFHAGLAAALLFTVGFLPRIILPVHFLLLWSLFERNPTILDGGDNFMTLTLVFLLCVDTGEHLALRGHLRRHRRAGPLRLRLAALVHNSGVLAIVLQLCVLYSTSALYKAQGDLWQSGTALYYILRVDEYTLPGWSAHVYEHATLVTMLTYGTVLFQLSFPFLLLNRVTRYVALVGAIAMHAGIAVLMGLVSFSLTIIAADLLLASDARYVAVAQKSRRLGREALRRARAGGAERRTPGRAGAHQEEVMARLEK